MSIQRRMLSTLGLGTGEVSRIDPLQGDKVAMQLMGQLRKGNWEGTEEHLASCRDWDQRQFYVDVLTDWDGRPAWVDDWTRSRPDCAVAWLVSGAHSIKWAWEARGGGSGGSVADSRWERFYERLQRAERELAKATTLDRDDPTPWGHMITCAVGLQGGLDACHKRFEAAIRRYPEHDLAHRQMLMATCEKWGGAHSMMFDFAEEASACAPTGSDVHSVIAMAHGERWLYDQFFTDDIQAARAYFRDAEVYESVLEAAMRSVLSDAHRETKLSNAARNMFAFCLWMGGEDELAADLFDEIGGQVTEHPWHWAGTPAMVFASARYECGA